MIEDYLTRDFVFNLNRDGIDTTFTLKAKVRYWILSKDRWEFEVQEILPEYKLEAFTDDEVDSLYDSLVEMCTKLDFFKLHYNKELDIA